MKYTTYTVARENGKLVSINLGEKVVRSSFTKEQLEALKIVTGKNPEGFAALNWEKLTVVEHENDTTPDASETPTEQEQYIAEERRIDGWLK
jgi:hypothetical protein